MLCGDGNAVNIAQIMNFLLSLIFCCVEGDILIFMPGQEDIEVTCDLITG